MLVKDINLYRNIQVSRSLLELSGRQLADGSRQTGGPLVVRNSTGTLLSAADSRFNGSSLFADCTHGLASSS